MYHGSQDWLRRISEKRGIGLDLFDATDLDDWRASVQPGKTSSVVWIETPVNPTWDVIDIAAAARKSPTTPAPYSPSTPRCPRR